MDLTFGEGLSYLKEEGISMPQTLRRIVVCVLFTCALAVLASQSVTASVGSRHALKAASAHTKTKKTTLCSRASSVRKAVIKKFTKQYIPQFGKKLGKKYAKRKPGLDICRFGLKGGKKPSNDRKARYLRTLLRLKNQPLSPTSAASSPATPPSPAANAGSTASSVLAAIGQCESGGNPSAVSPNGMYRGKYQFDYSTWASVGGSGDPAAASESEQDKRAAMLYAQGGATPWPICGH
jgi:hypothetical protein